MNQSKKKKRNRIKDGEVSSTPESGTPSAPCFDSFLDYYQYYMMATQRQRQPQPHAQVTEPLPFSLPVAYHNIHAIIDAYKDEPGPGNPMYAFKAIIDAYKDEPGNPMYAFKHLLFSVTEPMFRVKPGGVSEMMWVEAMGKLEGMERADRERLWPQLVHGFKDLSQRLLIQDEVIVSDAKRLRITQSNVKMLQRHVQTDNLPRIQSMKQREQILRRRLLRVMRIVEGLEGKGYRIPLTTGEAELAKKLSTITRQLKGSETDLCSKVQHLLMVSRVQTNSTGFGGSYYIPGSIKIHEQSLDDLQKVLQRQMEAIARIGSVLKRDIRDLEIMMAELTRTGTTEDGNSI